MISKFIAGILVVVALVGCGSNANGKNVSPEEAAQRAGLRRDQYSNSGKGEQKIVGTDGTITELLKVDDLGKYGLKLYPGATAKEGEAYSRTDKKNKTVFYSLFTSDPAKTVVQFYSKELKSKGTPSDDTGTILSGSLPNGKTAVVTVVDEKDQGSRIEVQVYEVLD